MGVYVYTSALRLKRKLFVISTLMSSSASLLEPQHSTDESSSPGKAAAAEESKTSLTSTSSISSVSSALPLSTASQSSCPSVSSLSSDLSKMSTSSSIGLASKSEAAPPSGAKVEEVVRGNSFRVSIKVAPRISLHEIFKLEVNR